MPTFQRRRWRRDSEFGTGPRVPLDREQRAVWRARLDLARRAGRITALHAVVGLALARRLGQDGRLDPSHETLAEDAGCSPRTVRRALQALGECGLARWVRRLVRTGWRAEQTSNAYELVVARCDGQAGRETTLIISFNRPTASGTAQRKNAREGSGWEQQCERAAAQLQALGFAVPATWGI